MQHIFPLIRKSFSVKRRFFLLLLLPLLFLHMQSYLSLHMRKKSTHHTQIPPPFAMIFYDRHFIYISSCCHHCCCFRFQHANKMICCRCCCCCFFAIHNICLASFMKLIFFRTHTHSHRQRGTHSHTPSRCSFVLCLDCNFVFLNTFSSSCFIFLSNGLMQCARTLQQQTTSASPLAKLITVKLSLVDLIPCLFRFLYVERSWKLFHAFTLLSVPSKCEIWNFFVLESETLTTHVRRKDEIEA